MQIPKELKGLMNIEERQEPATTEDSGGGKVMEQESSRGDFLKWGTVALGGLYVGPKITSFAINGSVGQAGSPAPSSHSSSSSSSSSTSYSSSYSSSTSYSSSVSTSQAVSLPRTGGGAGHSTAVTGNGGGSPAWIPVAGAATAAAGWYLRKQGQKRQMIGEPANDTEEAS